MELSKEYSLEDYSTPVVLAELSSLDRDAVMRYIHRGEFSTRVLSLMVENAALARYIENHEQTKGCGD